MESDPIDLSKKRFVVCIDEIQQNFVFGDEFSGRYAKTVTLSNGTTRTIELTPRQGLIGAYDAGYSLPRRGPSRIRLERNREPCCGLDHD